MNTEATERPATPEREGLLPVAITVDDLAQEIRRVDGNHSLGAGALAETLLPFIRRFAYPTPGLEKAVEALVALVTKPKNSPYKRDDNHACGSYFGEMAEKDFEYLLYALRTCNTFDYDRIMRAAYNRLVKIDAAIHALRALQGGNANG